MPSPSIQNTVANTFSGLKAKGLTEAITFSLVDDVAATDYDPSTGTFTDPTVTTKVVDAVVVSQGRTLGSSVTSGPSYKLTVLVDKADVGELDGYDTATYNGKSYSVESFDDNLYAVQIVMTREVG